MEGTLGSAKAAISLRLRRLTLSNIKRFHLGAALSASSVDVVGSICFAVPFAVVAALLFETAGVFVSLAVAEDIVDLLLLPCCGVVASHFSDTVPMLLSMHCGTVASLSPHT